MNTLAKIVFLALFAVALQHIARVIYVCFDFGSVIYKHYPGDCEVVKGFETHGAEDMTLLPSGKVIVTSGLAGIGNAYDYSKSLAKGALYVMDTNKNFNTVQKLTVKGWPADEHFEPHGIHHWEHKNKSVSVFVVLHMPETVGRFLYDGDKTLTLTKVYRNYTYMRNVNSVFVTGEDNFYFSNLQQARFGDQLMISMEAYMLRAASDIVYVKGDNYQTVDQGLMFPNGLAGDDRYVYLATTGAIRVYTRQADGTLDLFKVIPVGIALMDNLKLDADGNLWVGCQNVLRELLAHLEQPDSKVHSTVIRVRDPTGDAQLETVFVDDSSLIRAATVGVYTKGKLLIGSIRDKMLSCDVHYLPGQ